MMDDIKAIEKALYAHDKLERSFDGKLEDDEEVTQEEEKLANEVENNAIQWLHDLVNRVKELEELIV